MADIIRRIEKRDFTEVSDLFIMENGILEEGNTVEELMWLFTDPENKNQFNAFVAVDDSNTIIGVIGYALSMYTQKAKVIIGVTPFSWKLKSNYKGIAGISLFRKVSELGDIGIAIGGTDIARKLYPLFKYKFLIHSNNYYKMLSISNYYKTLKRKNILKKMSILGFLLPSYFIFSLNKSLNKDKSLIPYNYRNFVEDKEFENVFKKKITKNYIDWQLNCPRLNAYAFVVKKGNDNLGMCVLNIQKFENTFKGRIVHLPYLGNNKNLWISVIKKCLVFFRKKGCCFVSGLAINNMCQQGLYKSGFIKIKSHHEPIYIKDSLKRTDQFNIDNWHFQFSEGDIGFMDL